jgi:ribosome biogenesis GTPase A
MAASDPAGPLPFAFFVGDFNTGKSTLINALLRDNVLRCDRQETRSLPALVYRGAQGSPQFGALPPDGAVHRKTLSQFQGMRSDESNTAGYRAAIAHTPSSPFSRLVLIDTPGTSSDSVEAAPPEFGAVRSALMVVVTDIEYWSSKHNLRMIANYQETFGGALLVVANKADHLNISEIERLHKKASVRMEEFGISPAPRFFALSARLEALRTDRDDEYRKRTKPTVRAHCDAAFDAFRVALYEFEAGCVEASGVDELELLNAPLAQCVMNGAPTPATQESHHEV